MLGLGRFVLILKLCDLDKGGSILPGHARATASFSLDNSIGSVFVGCDNNSKTSVWFASLDTGWKCLKSWLRLGQG